MDSYLHQRFQMNLPKTSFSCKVLISRTVPWWWFSAPDIGLTKEVQRSSSVLLSTLSREYVPECQLERKSFVSIADLEGWGYSNSDIRGYLAALSILQDCYPERLGKLFIVHVPYVFMTAWKVVYPFIDRKTKNKIIFVENKRLKSTLLDDIDESQLPDVYGGKLSLVPIQDV
ncbi:hypothetical protein OIU74_014284 [Salix koriyanagi]|uniref:CRAL-TRIO domain-containing protein n=1 Tax=Salix koriyanagi TaxID=2511006 RepID=A0A9Q0SZJ4_9ROSI|nr:hypothetical protein OIU74_014284 [Salix koriyanagi]